MLNHLSSGPIGVFDSGVGGLTVARAIRALLPHEDIVYFGDTLHLPYGEKSKEAIERYSNEITSFLRSRGAKCVLIACNSASANAQESLHLLFPDTIFINVIDPVIEKVKNDHCLHIGVIGTKATMRSEAYQKKLKNALPNAKITAKPTPLLAAMIEEGFTSGAVAQSVINAYIENDEVIQGDALILGCTHYPLIQKEIARLLPENCTIVDTPKVVAEYLRDLLDAQQLNNPQTQKGSISFYLSDLTPSFEQQARLFFGEKVEISEIDIS